jgi:hypothetical protein
LTPGRADPPEWCPVSEFLPLLDIVGLLEIPGIELVFIDLRKPGPFSVILQMANAKILFLPVPMKR